jgi:Uma2 family endonuclease
VTARRGDGTNAASALLCWWGFGEIAQGEGVSMSAAPKRRLTAEEYLALERQAAFKSEFYRGEMFAMAGARYLHNRVLANLTGLLFGQLQGSPCFVLPNDMRVKVPSSSDYFYPDLIVVCGKPQFEDNVFDTLLNPQVILEVLSETTERFDRGEKFDEYGKIASLKEYLLVSQSKMQIQRFVRRSEDNWDMRIFKDAAGDFSLETVKVTIPMKDIYFGVEFSQSNKEANAP